MSTLKRSYDRRFDEMRPVSFERGYTRHGEGSVLVSFGDTKVLCTASVEKGVPRFLKGKNQGWLTAEYGMLPRSTHTRMGREASRGKQSGRTVEIQRLIGRSLRAAVDLSKLGEHTIQIDCDVLQADGGTRTASISGACVALVDAIDHMKTEGLISESPLINRIASVSVGIVEGQAVLDLDYPEDSNAQTDMNIIMAEGGGIVEIQGTAEQTPFTEEEFQSMFALAKKGINEILDKQG